MVGGGGPTHYRPYLRVLSWLFVNLSIGVNQDVREDPELDKNAEEELREAIRVFDGVSASIT